MEEKIRIEIEIGSNLQRTINDILGEAHSSGIRGYVAVQEALNLDLTKIVEVAIKREKISGS